jgi:hypothetical protein
MTGMRTILLLGPALLALAASSHAADKAPCAAKPFALTKPALPAAAKPVVKVAPVKVAAKPAKPLADCKSKRTTG